TRKLSKKLRSIFGRKRRREISELSTSGIHQAVRRAIATAPTLPTSGDHLDVGSRTGELLLLLRAHYPFRSFGCDYTDKLLSVPGPEIPQTGLFIIVTSAPMAGRTECLGCSNDEFTRPVAWANANRYRG